MTTMSRDLAMGERRKLLVCAVLALLGAGAHAEDRLEKYELTVGPYRLCDRMGSGKPWPYWQQDYIIDIVRVRSFSLVGTHLVGTTFTGRFFIIYPPDEERQHP